ASWFQCLDLGIGAAYSAKQTSLPWKETVSQRRVIIQTILLMGLSPASFAQKPSGPQPSPPPTSQPPPGVPASSVPSTTTQPIQQDLELVMFIRGRVAPGDGSVLPSNVMVERICNTRVRQQVYATLQGDFNMQLGSMADSFVDASGDREGGLPETRV